VSVRMMSYIFLLLKMKIAISLTQVIFVNHICSLSQLFD
jgi:hypothetical protein